MKRLSPQRTDDHFLNSKFKIQNSTPRLGKPREPRHPSRSKFLTTELFCLSQLFATAPLFFDCYSGAEIYIVTDNVKDQLTGQNLINSPVGASDDDPLIGTLHHAQTDTSRTLEVTGQGIISIPTNTAKIQVGIEIEGETATEVQQAIAQRSSEVVEQLNQLGVIDLQTISISLFPKIDYEQDDNPVVGFKGSNVLQFEIATEQAGETIDAAIQAGANIIQDISFIAPEAELNQARLDALELAVQDAQSQATSVFNNLGLQPLEIVDIDIIEVSSPRSTLPFVEFEAAAFAVSTPIIGGDQDVIASVALDINYAPL